MTTTLDIQRRLIALGYPVGAAGADGKYGDQTRTGIAAALTDLEKASGARLPAPAAPAIARAAFFAAVRSEGLFGGRISSPQVHGMEALLDGWERSDLTDRRYLAYMFATAYHETARTMQPVRETLASTDDHAIAILDRSFAAGKLNWVKTPYWRKDGEGKSWLGRGLVQLTHRKNYETMSAILGVDLVGNPGLAMDPEIAVRIMIEGMTRGASLRGDFTGKSLEDYFGSSVEDWTNARRIINGTESASTVAGYGRLFYRALVAA